MSLFRRNLFAGVAITLLLLFPDIVGPRSHFHQTQLSCSTAPSEITNFSNMDACTEDPSYRAGCGCSPVKNPWYPVYRLGLIPLLAGLFGCVILRGTLMTRLLFLNLTIPIALAADFIRAFLKEANSLMALPFLPFIAIAFCLMITAWFFLFYGITSLVKNVQKSSKRLHT